MLTPLDFPLLELRRPFKRLSVNCEDPASGKSIQDQIWSLDEGYSYTRTRQDLENTAIRGCAFCCSIVSGDVKYQKEMSKNKGDVAMSMPRLVRTPRTTKPMMRIKRMKRTRSGQRTRRGTGILMDMVPARPGFPPWTKSLNSR
jgi:hypothetical protein